MSSPLLIPPRSPMGTSSGSGWSLGGAVMVVAATELRDEVADMRSSPRANATLLLSFVVGGIPD